jgi:hypothetical protein
VPLLCLEVRLLLLRLVVLRAVLLLVLMRAVGWLERWLVRWRLGRVRCRILVSTCLPALCGFDFVESILTIFADDEKDDDDW